MRIFGIDPGPISSAYCLWNGVQIVMCGIEPNTKLEDRFIEVKDDCDDVVAACEHIQCMGMPVGASVFETAYWIGSFRNECRWHSVLFLPVYRSEVKLHFCNSMRAKDANIRQALIDRLGAPGTKQKPGLTYGVKGDIWSALAIAVMVYDKTQKDKPRHVLD
jgi:hypothetical protein